MKEKTLDRTNTEKLLNKIWLFHFIAGNKKAEEKPLEEEDNTKTLPMNKLEYDLIIYERNPFPQTAYLGFYPKHVEFLEIQESDYSKGIAFEGTVEWVEQIDKQYFYTVKTKYGHIIVETLDKKKEIEEPVKVGIPDECLYYFDIDENRLKRL